jgi:low affinity Fe/Cu permease
VINTATTILTFLMVFVIQNSLNRGNKALHLKLDELIRTSEQAHDAIIGAQELSESEIDRLEKIERAGGDQTS